LNGLDAKKVGSQLPTARPRGWERITRFGQWAEWCNAEIGDAIIKNCDQAKLLEQIRKSGRSNSHELRMLIFFLANGSGSLQPWFKDGLKEVVRETCSSKDDWAKSMLGAYAKLDPAAASALATELDLEPEIIKDKVDVYETDELAAMRRRHREWDARGQDYDLDLS
jgi:hypothetical protein